MSTGGLLKTKRSEVGGIYPPKMSELEAKFSSSFPLQFLQQPEQLHIAVSITDGETEAQSICVTQQAVAEASIKCGSLWLCCSGLVEQSQAIHRDTGGQRLPCPGLLDCLPHLQGPHLISLCTLGPLCVPFLLLQGERSCQPGP